MASQDRGTSSAIRKSLLDEGRRFSFVQAIRLLRLLDTELFDVERQEPFRPGHVRVRPDVSLGFPAADVAKIENRSDQTAEYQVTATFLGLYGSSSPLPTFYSEDILDEVGDNESVTRDFIDIIHERVFSLFFRCWTKYRQFIKVAEENSPQYVERLFCLLGLGEKQLKAEAFEPYRLLRYLGLFTQHPRSALALKTLLGDAMGGMNVELIPCAHRRAKIPPDQRISLGLVGSVLGQDSFLGEEIDDRMSKFVLEIGPLSREQFHSLFPGNPNYVRLNFLTQFYLTDSLEYDLELILRAGEANTVCLGGTEWANLGLDTWIFSGETLGEVRAIIHTRT